MRWTGRRISWRASAATVSGCGQKVPEDYAEDCVALRGLGCQIQFMFVRELASVDKIK